MTPIPSPIVEFLDRHHVMTISTCVHMRPWAASVFYLFDATQAKLFFLTETRTRHGTELLENAWAAGTIAGQPENVRDIEGVQFTAHATLMENEAAQAVMLRYYARFPVAKKHSAPIWQLTLEHLKLTDNHEAFGRKTLWERTSAMGAFAEPGTTPHG